MDTFYHEQLFRSAEVMARLRPFPVTICGAGALGANLAESLARTGFARLRVIDHDRVEERNLSTQPWQRADVGAHKAKLLANGIYRAVGAKVEPLTQTLTASNAAKLLGGSALVVDCFDNSTARRAVTEWATATGTPCLHAGLSAEGYAEVLWNEEYRVPSDAGDDVCDYPLARNLAMLAATVACEAAVRFVATGERQGFTITLGDLNVSPREALI